MYCRLFRIWTSFRSSPAVLPNCLHLIRACWRGAPLKSVCFLVNFWHCQAGSTSTLNLAVPLQSKLPNSILQIESIVRFDRIWLCILCTAYRICRETVFKLCRSSNDRLSVSTWENISASDGYIVNFAGKVTRATWMSFANFKMERQFSGVHDSLKSRIDGATRTKRRFQAISEPIW